MFKNAFTALALVGAMATAHAAPLLIDEGFDNVDTLEASGWRIFSSTSLASGYDAWFQGSEGVFSAQAGAGYSYVASSWQTAPDGVALANWLLTPIFSTAQNAVVSFWARGEVVDGYTDNLVFGLVNAAGDVSSLATSTATTVLGDWTQYSVTLSGQGDGATGRFAIGYIGDPATSNFVGVDSVTAAVPEPTSFALAALSLLGLGATVRRRAKR